MKRITMVMAACMLTSILAVLAGGNDDCQKRYLRFTSVPTYTYEATIPCSCQESFQGGTWLAKPRYIKQGSVYEEGTSRGVVMYSTRNGENGAWSTATELTWSKNDYGSKVTWGNGHQRTGAGETTYTFTTPTTPITYTLLYKTHDLLELPDGSQVLEYTLVGGHVESTTQAGGTGISVPTWPLTTPLTNDPIGTRRAMYHKDPQDQTYKFGVFRRVAMQNGPHDWQLEYQLPKP